MNKIKGIMNLPKMVELKKTTVNVEETEKAVDRMHENAPSVEPVVESATEKIQKASAPSSAPRQKKKTSPPPPKPVEKKPVNLKTSTKTTDILDENTTRITIDLPESIYKGAKIKSFNEMMTLKSYIVGLLRDDLNI